MTSKRNEYKKMKSTILPMGFAVGLIDDDLVIVDFLDELNQEKVIAESIVLTKSKAKELVKSLNKIINNDEKEN